MNENILLQNEKNRFLADEFFMLSWAAATQHNKTWEQITEESDKKEFRQKIKNRLEKMMLNYADKIIDSITHINNIQLLQDFSKDEGEELDIGKCQKLLNMMCKYYWCAGWICEPPDMPIDSINLSKMPTNRKIKVANSKIDKEPSKINWTSDLLTKTDYENVIKCFSDYTKSQGYESVAVWELCNWKRKSNQE